MAYEIISEEYYPRKPKVTIEADSVDDLAVAGTDFAEGSTADVDGTTYVLDRTEGWVKESGGGGGGATIVTISVTEAGAVLSMKAGELFTACGKGPVITYYDGEEGALVAPILYVDVDTRTNNYMFATAASEGYNQFTASGADEYPVSNAG